MLPIDRLRAAIEALDWAMNHETELARDEWYLACMQATDILRPYLSYMVREEARHER